uniref:HMG box domain-containing protein n=1 Tax=Heterorhabditis bacteriophora TaxID=37862 RepID=A0A1I7XHE8_HETBA
MDEFSVYNIPLESYTDWWLIQPTLPLIVSTQQRINFPLTHFLMKDDRRNPKEYESNRPVSAYAMFFREKQAIVKIRWPDASFGHISKIVAAQWEMLTKDEKEIAAVEKVRRICESTAKKVEEENANDDKIISQR